MPVPKTRLVLGATIVAVLAVVSLFALGLISNRNAERDAARQRFTDQAGFSAGVIESSYGAAVPVLAKRNAELYGGAKPNQAALDLLIVPHRVDYAYVLDAKGKVLISAGDMRGASVTGAPEWPGHLAAVLGGAPWRVSSLDANRRVEYAQGFEGRDGRRALVYGWPVERVALSAGDTLDQLPRSVGKSAYLVDGAGKVLASTDPDVEVARPAPTAVPGDQDLTTAGIERSDWKVVLLTSRATLYDGPGSLIGWGILLVLALAGAIGVWQLRRGMAHAAAARAAGAALATSNAELERTVAELNRSNGELQQFASVASHDLQEPLRKVQAFGEQLERRAKDDLDERSQDFLRRMRGASARMSTLIDDLLRFSRVSTGARPSVGVDLAHIAVGVVSDLETRIAETGGTVEIGALPRVQADPTQMRQLLQNLIANSLKFHAPGRPPVVRVEPAAGAPPGLTAFTVSDNGIGFEAEYGERIFEVFERLHAREAYEGTGIGLALCRKIAERHGGAITAGSHAGEGATFTVTLPPAEDSVDRPQQRAGQAGRAAVALQ